MEWLTDEKRLALFPAGPLSETLIITNLRHVVGKIWTCADLEFRFCWMKLRSSDNYYTTAGYITIRIIKLLILYLYFKPEFCSCFSFSFLLFILFLNYSKIWKLHVLNQVSFMNQSLIGTLKKLIIVCVYVMCHF